MSIEQLLLGISKLKSIDIICARIEEMGEKLTTEEWIRQGEELPRVIKGMRRASRPNLAVVQKHLADVEKIAREKAEAAKQK